MKRSVRATPGADHDSELAAKAGQLVEVGDEPISFVAAVFNQWRAAPLGDRLHQRIDLRNIDCFGEYGANAIVLGYERQARRLVCRVEADADVVPHEDGLRCGGELGDMPLAKEVPHGGWISAELNASLCKQPNGLSRSIRLRRRRLRAGGAEE